MPAAATLTPREVAELSGAPKRVVEKAIEERVIRARFLASHHGARMTACSVLGRVDHGDTTDDILAENPDLAREALEAAVTYARTHPLMGRPGGRPWAGGG